jgi:ariadne-1
MHFRWNRDTLIDKYMDTPNSVLTAVGEPISSASHALNGITSTAADSPRKRVRHSVSPPSPPSAARACGVCFDDCGDDDRSFRCGHLFCRECWTMYLTDKVFQEGQCAIRCMGVGCKALVDETFLNDLVDEACVLRSVILNSTDGVVDLTHRHSSHSLYRRPFFCMATSWKASVSDSYISNNSDFRFCPHPSCEQAVSCPGARGSFLLTQVPSVECGGEPSHSFCFGCGLDQSHIPVICKIATLWVNSKDSGTDEWIKVC